MTQCEHRLLVVVEEAIERCSVSRYGRIQFIAEIGAVSEVLLTFTDDQHLETRLGQRDRTVKRVKYSAGDGWTFAIE